MGLELARAFVAVRADSSRVQKDLASLQSPMVAQTSKIGMAMGKALSMAMVAAGVAGFAGIFSVAAREVVGFERKMIDVRANARLLGKEGGEAFQLLNMTARELGATTQFTAKQSAEALDWMVLGGLKAREAMAAVPGVLNLASSANLELAESAKIVIDNMRKYGMEANSTGKIADFFSSSQSRAQITARDLAQGLQSLGSITTSMNVSFRDTVALLTGMGRAGTEMSRGGTALSMALFRLAAPPKEAEKALRLMNIQVRSFVDEESGVLNLISLFKAIALALPTDPIERGAAAAALFGMRAREVLGVLNLMRDTTFVKETQVGLMEDLGRAATVSEAKLDTFWGMLKKVRSVLGELAIAGLTPVLKSLQPLLDDIRAGTAIFAKFVAQVSKVGGALGDMPFGWLLSWYGKVTRAGILLTGGLIAMQFAVGKLTLAYKALGGAIGMTMLIGGKWKIALIALVGVIDTLVIHSIARLSIALDVLVAHPVIPVLVALAAGAALVAHEWEKGNRAIEEGNRITAKFVGIAKEQEKAVAKQVNQLLKLANAGELNNEQAKEARQIIADLEERYGALGIRVDQAAGAITGMVKALDLIAQQNRDVQDDALNRHLIDLSRQYTEAMEKSTKFYRDQVHWFGEMDRLYKEMTKTRKELDDLREKPVAIPGVNSGKPPKRDIDEGRKERQKAAAKAAFEARKDLFSAIGELDPTTVTNEFNELYNRVSSITRQFPELEGAGKRFLELEWKKTPFGRVQSQLEDAKLKTMALRNNWENWRIELTKFSRQPWVTPAQIEAMGKMLSMQDRDQKKKSQDDRFKDAAARVREELETPVDKMIDFIIEIKQLAARGRLGLPGGLTQAEAIARLKQEGQGVLDEGKIEAGRYGAAGYGKALQDAFLKTHDPAKKTAENTGIAAKKLILIDQGIAALVGQQSKFIRPAVYSK